MNSAPSPEEVEDPLGGIEKTPTPEATIEAVTLKPVVDAYCDAMRKKDEAGLRAVYSRATVQSFERDMRSEGIATLVEFLETGLVPRFPTAILSTGLMLLAALNLFTGLILDTVVRGRQEVRRLAYLSHPAPGGAL